MNLFHRQQHDKKHASVTFTISGMHCTSCALNIDGELEDLPGVVQAQTNYARATTNVEYDAKTVDVSTLAKTIESLGYSISHSSTDAP